MNNSYDDYESSLYKSAIYMHDLEFDLAYTTQLQTYSDSRYLQYSIQNKKHNVPELFVRYDSTRELMEVLSFKAQAKCVLDISIKSI